VAPAVVVVPLCAGNPEHVAVLPKENLFLFTQQNTVLFIFLFVNVRPLSGVSSVA
jgi:hypothetical protein